MTLKTLGPVSHTRMDCYHDPTLHPYKDFISIPSKLFELHAYRQNVRKNGPSLAKVKTFLALYISFSKVTPTPIQHSLCVCQSSVRSILLWHCGPEEFPSRLITVTNNLSMGRGKKTFMGIFLSRLLIGLSTAFCCFGHATQSQG